jgi:hypothetical protein
VTNRTLLELALHLRENKFASFAVKQVLIIAFLAAMGEVTSLQVISGLKS